MNPVHTEIGKTYYAIRCANPNCKERLPLIEIPPSEREQEVARSKVSGAVVRCFACTQETRVRDQLVFVLAVR